jgi:hypothetical protein
MIPSGRIITAEQRSDKRLLDLQRIVEHDSIHILQLRNEAEHPWQLKR